MLPCIKILARQKGVLKCLCFGIVFGLIIDRAISIQTDQELIKYIEKKPEEGTPQAIAITFLLLREEGKIEELKEHLSQECPEWKRESMLKPVTTKDNPIKMDSLRYKLEEYTPEKAKVILQYNSTSGTYHEYPCQLIQEKGMWVLR